MAPFNTRPWVRSRRFEHWAPPDTLRIPRSSISRRSSIKRANPIPAGALIAEALGEGDDGHPEEPQAEPERDFRASRLSAVGGWCAGLAAAVSRGLGLLEERQHPRLSPVLKKSLRVVDCLLVRIRDAPRTGLWRMESSPDLASGRRHGDSFVSALNDPS